MILLKIFLWIFAGFGILWIEDSINRKKQVAKEYKLIVFIAIYGVSFVLWIRDTFFENTSLILSYVFSFIIGSITLILMVRLKDLITSKFTHPKH